MTADIKKIVNCCVVCSEYDSATVKEPFVPHEALTRPSEKIGVNIAAIRSKTI